MTGGPKYRDGAWLREQYVDKQLSTYEIAEKCGCSDSTVRDWMDRHDIPTRRDGPQIQFERLRDAEWLREQYVEKSNTCADIAEICGCSGVAVLNSLDRHGIETRRPVTDERLRDSDWLEKEYLEKERTGVDIAQEVGCSAAAVYRWIEKHGFETRSYRGADNPNWKGGPAPYGRGWDEAKRRAVRQRDDYTCQDPRCSVAQTDHVNEYGQKLHVHHLRKARDVDGPEKRNAKENLITLCCECHQRWEKMADAGLAPEVDV